MKAGGGGKLVALIAAALCVATTPSPSFASTYYKLGTDAANQTSFSGAYSGGGTTIGWRASRDASVTTTVSDMANSDFVVVSGTRLRSPSTGGSYTFGGRSLVLESGGDFMTKGGEAAPKQATSYDIASLVGAGGTVYFNCLQLQTLTGAISINSGSSLTFCLNENVNGVVSSTMTGDDTTTLFVGTDSTVNTGANTLEISDAAGFYGTVEKATDSTAGFTLKLTGGFGGTVASLPSGTTKVLVNYDGLPSGKGLRVATTTIPTPIKTTVTFYSTKNVFLDGDVLMTFPAGTVVDTSAFTVYYAYGVNETGTAFPDLQKIDNQDGTVSLAVKSKTYYKLGTDAANKTSFSGTYDGGGTTIGWTDSRTGTAAVTPTDMANADFIVVPNTMLRTKPTKGSYTFPGKTLIFETGGSMTVKAGESGSAGASTFAIPKIVGAGGKISLNAAKCTHTFTGAMHINAGSSFTLSFTGSDARSGIFNSTFTGDDTTTLYLLAFAGNTAQTLEFSNAAGFLGTIADGGTGAANEKIVLNLTGGFGGTITSLPAGTTKVLVNYDGLPSGKGLRVATTTIPTPIKTTVTFYASSATFLSDGFVLMTFPAGTSVDPSAFTVKYAGSASETARTFAHLKKIDNADGTVSLAVFNDGDFPTAGETIDLAGASRDIPSDWVGFCAGFTVTDTVGGGEARVEVASGVTVTNTRMSLAGKLKFVKDGGGTFVSALEQTYTGGNLIAGGVAMPPEGGGTSVNYMPSNGWKGFGDHAAAGDEAAVIRVNTGAVFDINGVYGFCKHKIILNGGTLRNSVAETYYQNARPGVVIHSLEADSFADFQQDTRYWDGTAADTAPCNLNGFTLKLSVGGGRHVGVSSSFTNGTLEYLTGGYFYPVHVNSYTPSFIDMSTVDFVQSASLKIGTETRVRDYMCKYTGSACSGSAEFKVFGTFTPESQKFYGATMQDGSAINLSEKDGAFSTASGFSGYSLQFAAPATITVLTGDRALTAGEQLIGWTSGAAPDSTVKFVPQPSMADKWRFKVQSDGVYAMKKKGITIIVK
ncbi:MAG: hypothetical protein IJI54_15180 [Kiritimatiellae bacterium]|nr:hypothetical protein [Kiritimatiellia bacterium]